MHIGDNSILSLTVVDDVAILDKPGQLIRVDVFPNQPGPTLLVQPQLLQVEVVLRRVCLQYHVIEVGTDTQIQVNLFPIQMLAYILGPQ
jgi:hypothetical protein